MSKGMSPANVVGVRTHEADFFIRYENMGKVLLFRHNTRV